MTAHPPHKHPTPPSVNAVLRAPAGALAVARFGRAPATAAVRAAIDAARPAVRAGTTPADPAALADAALAGLERAQAPSLRPVLNLTGTVLHTNLGRALLAAPAIEAALAVMAAPAALEYDLDSGGRGERDDHVRGLLRELTGAEDALVVNNNAAARAARASTRWPPAATAIVSRGELIEIGGAFRLPDDHGPRRRAPGRGRHHQPHPSARLRSRRSAPHTALLLQGAHLELSHRGLHRRGAGARAGRHRARSAALPLIDDLGSGTWSTSRAGACRRSPRPREAVRGRRRSRDLLRRQAAGRPAGGLHRRARGADRALHRHPLKRALRVDKMRLAALEATLRLYRTRTGWPSGCRRCAC